MGDSIPGGAFTGNGEQAIIKARVQLHKMKDGRVEILCSQTEMGQGFHTILPKIVAHVLEAAPVVSGVTTAFDGDTRMMTVGYTLSEDAIVTVDILTNGVSIGAKSRSPAFTRSDSR